MGIQLATTLMQEAFWVLFTVTLPILIISLSVGIFISIIQVSTQIQEATLSFVPKLFAVGAVIIVTGAWMLQELTQYAQHLYQNIPNLI